MILRTTTRYGLLFSMNRNSHIIQHRALSPKINSDLTSNNAYKPQKLHEWLQKRADELNIPALTSGTLTLEECAEQLFKAAKDGRISNISIPIIGPKCTVEEAKICCSGEWKLKKNYALLRKAADEGRLILPQNMPFSEKE